MRQWKNVYGLLKDHNSIWLSSLSRKSSPFGNPDMEAAVIKATSHDEMCMDMKNIDRVYKWIRLSPVHLKSLLWAISIRMDKTRSWVVAIKGLMLMHGVYSSRLSAVERIGRLPFDLSTFKDGHSCPYRNWGINAFVRAYFTYLDQKSSLIFMNLEEKRNLMSLDKINDNINDNDDDKNKNNNDTSIEKRYSMIRDLVLLQKLQFLLDMLLEIRPLCDSAIVPLVLEATECVMIEVFDIYSRICNGIARVLLRVHSAGKVEARMVLRILEKATIQGEELSLYFELCRSIGVKNAEECPKIEQIPEEDIRELINIINGVPEKQIHQNESLVQETNTHHIDNLEDLVINDKLRTVITDKWESFDEDLVHNEDDSCARTKVTPPQKPNVPQELPDLISFL